MAKRPPVPDSGEALRRSEARLRAVLDTAVDSIITINERGVIQSVNRATERMFGYGEAEMVGRNVSMLMPPPYREDHDGYLARYLRTGERRIIGIGREVRAQRKDGSVFAIDLAVSEVEPGKLFTGIIRDVSDRKLAEARVREADRMASIGTLAAGLGHDMNNVLLPVRARLNALKVAALGPRERGHVDGIAKSVAYLQQLADGLHFLAMDPDKDQAEGASTDLAAWWTQTGPLVSKAVPRHVRVTASWPDGMPEVGVPAHALTQAVLNLVVNAGEAIPERKRVQGRVRLSASVVDDGSRVHLSVSDNGKGMTDEVLRRAFEMFYTTKPRGLGTGLGLPLVRKVAERAGGTVRIDSQLGRGTTVTMELPAVRPVEGDAPAAAVTVGDGRGAALVRQVLGSGGVRIVNGDGAPAASIWVVEPGAAPLAAVRAWRSARPGGVLVLFGGASGADGRAWRALRPIIIGDCEDFEAVRAALGRAIAGL